MNKHLMLVATLCTAAALSFAQTTPATQSGATAPTTAPNAASQSPATAPASSSDQMQSPSSAMAKPQADANHAQPAGPGFPAKLAKSYDSKKVKAGDEIDAKTAAGMTAANGTQIPEGSKIVGHISDAKAKSKGDSESSLTFAFEKIVLKDGKELPFKAVAQAIGAGQSAASAAFPENGGPNSQQAQNGMKGGASPAVAGSSAGNSGASSATPAGIAAQDTSAGQLGPNSTGVVGIKGLNLDSQSNNSKVSSDSKSVKLDEGTQLLLRVIPQ